MKSERIDKILGNLGYGSRKDIKKFARDGLVRVDGEVVKDSSTKVDPEKSEIMIGEELINYRENIYLMMNKPQGYISATEDNYQETVLDLLEIEDSVLKPFPVGRLDKDTEGLLILSTDGKLAHRVLSPKKHVKKGYYAEVSGRVDDKDIEMFEEGLDIEGEYMTKPARLKVIEAGDISKVEVEIVEGKFHQVKRMFEAVGKEVIYLKRIYMGCLKLDDSLELGEYRELTDDEIVLLETR